VYAARQNFFGQNPRCGPGKRCGRGGRERERERGDPKPRRVRGRIWKGTTYRSLDR